MFQLLIFINLINWLPFNTEKKLYSACNLCRREINILRKNSSAFISPLNNSFCNSTQSENQYCLLIHDIRKDILSRFVPKIPSNYCSQYGPCIFSCPSNLSGSYCANCLSLITLTFGANSDKRQKIINDYCSSAYGSSIPFCNAIQYMIKKSMKEKFIELNDPLKFCIDSAFCYKQREQASNDKYESENVHQRSHFPNASNNNEL